MTAVLVGIVLGVVAYVAYEIARITAQCSEIARGEERVVPTLADQPTAEEVGQPAKGMER